VTAADTDSKKGWIGKEAYLFIYFACWSANNLRNNLTLNKGANLINLWAFGSSRSSYPKVCAQRCNCILLGFHSCFGCKCWL